MGPEWTQNEIKQQKHTQNSSDEENCLVGKLKINKTKKNNKNKKTLWKSKREWIYIWTSGVYNKHSTEMWNEQPGIKRTAKIHNARRIKMCKLFLNIQTVFQLEKLNSIHLLGLVCILSTFFLCVLLRLSMKFSFIASQKKNNIARIVSILLLECSWDTVYCVPTAYKYRYTTVGKTEQKKR